MPLDKDGRLAVPRFLDEPSRPFPDWPFLHEVTAPQLTAVIPAAVVGLLAWLLAGPVATAIFGGAAGWAWTLLYTGRPRPPITVWAGYFRRQGRYLSRWLPRWLRAHIQTHTSMLWVAMQTWGARPEIRSHLQEARALCQRLWRKSNLSS